MIDLNINEQANQEMAVTNIYEASNQKMPANEAAQRSQIGERDFSNTQVAASPLNLIEKTERKPQ